MKYRIIKRTNGAIDEYKAQRKWLGIWWNMSSWSMCYRTTAEKISKLKLRKRKKIHETLWEEEL